MVTKLGAGSAVGNLAYWNGVSWVVLAPPASRKFLKQAAAEAPAWDLPADTDLSVAAQAAISASHAAITLGTDADVLLGLSTQQIVLDSQNANVVFAGPATGAAADPTFRSLVAADIPDISATYSAKAGNISLITVGTITTGHWHGDAVDAEHGGTGLTVGVSGGFRFSVLLLL